MLTNEDKEFIRSCMQNACQCGLSQDSAKEMGHLVGCLRDLGDGNLNRGIEIFKKGIIWVRLVQKRGEKIGGALAVFIVISLAGGAIALFSAGARAMIAAIKGTP